MFINLWSSLTISETELLKIVLFSFSARVSYNVSDPHIIL